MAQGQRPGVPSFVHAANSRALAYGSTRESAAGLVGQASQTIVERAAARKRSLNEFETTRTKVVVVNPIPRREKIVDSGNYVPDVSDDDDFSSFQMMMTMR